MDRTSLVNHANMLGSGFLLTHKSVTEGAGPDVLPR